MQQLSADDAQFIYLETDRNRGYITSVCLYDPSGAPGGAVSYHEFLQHMESRLHLSRLFTQRLQRVPMDLDFPYWVTDEHFDLESHISWFSLPSDAEWGDFCRLVGRFHSERLDMERPLWAMQVIDGLGKLEGFPEECYAVMIKAHHCAIDGAAGVRFLMAISDLNASGTPLLRNPRVQQEEYKPVELATMLSNAYDNQINSQVRITDSLVRAFPKLYPKVTQAFRAIPFRAAPFSSGSAEQPKVPQTRFNKPTSPDKVFDRYTVSQKNLRDLRSLAKGATQNDVVLAVVGGALRRYLQHHDELPEQPLVAWTPINAKPKRSKGDEQHGNHLEAMTVPLYTDVEDPVQRLQLISAASDQAKQGESGATVRMATRIGKQFPGPTLAFVSRVVARSGVAGRTCNVFVSSISGPKRAIYMNGAKCIDVFGMGPLADGMGLFIATPSYYGRLNFCITSTREILPDINFFIDCLSSSHQQLCDQLLQQQSAAKKAVKKSAENKKSTGSKKSTGNSVAKKIPRDT